MTTLSAPRKPRLAALVPMRHYSRRVPGKNYRPLGGRPLYHHIVQALLQCPSVDRVVIDTDSDFILQDAAASFPPDRLALLLRPQHLRDEHTPMNDVLLNTTAAVEADFYLQTHSTNPLLRPATIQRAIDTFLAQYPAYDSLFAVTRLQARLWDALARPINHNPAILLRTQDLPPVYEENSCLYLFTRDDLLARHNRIGQRPLLFEIQRPESCDIDDEADFQLAQLLWSQSQRQAPTAAAS